MDITKSPLHELFLLRLFAVYLLWKSQVGEAKSTAQVCRSLPASVLWQLCLCRWVTSRFLYGDETAGYIVWFRVLSLHSFICRHDPLSFEHLSCRLTDFDSSLIEILSFEILSGTGKDRDLILKRGMEMGSGCIIGLDVWRFGSILFACLLVFLSVLGLLTHTKNVSLCNDQCETGRLILRMCQKLKRSDFVGHYEYDKCQNLHDGSTH